MEKNSYFPDQVAELLEVPEDRVVELIRKGRLKADFLDNVGTYMIPRRDLLRYLKFCRDTSKLRRMVSRRVLLVDRNSDMRVLLKAELEERGVTVRIGTSERDIDLAVQDFRPDVLLVHMAATLRAKNAVKEALGRAKTEGIFVVVYHDYDRRYERSSRERFEQFQATGADDVVSVMNGARELIHTVLRRLGPLPQP